MSIQLNLSYDKNKEIFTVKITWKIKTSIISSAIFRTFCGNMQQYEMSKYQAGDIRQIAGKYPKEPEENSFKLK